MGLQVVWASEGTDDLVAASDNYHALRAIIPAG